MIKLHELIPNNLILQQRFDALPAFDRGLLLGTMARIDQTPINHLCYFPDQGEVWIHSFCDADLIAALHTVMEFFRDAFPDQEEHNEEEQQQ